MDLSNRIVQIRNSLGISQEKFGELVGKSQRTVAAWESGMRSPSFATLCRLADVLDVSTDYLLGRTEIPNIYLDTEKNPSRSDRERAISIANTVANESNDRITVSDDADIPPALRKYVRMIVRQELERQDTPDDD